MADFRAGRLLPVVSVVVAAEVEPAPGPVRERFGDLLRWGAEMIDVNEEARDLAAAYASQRILPARFSNDALHIALATVAGVDVVTSWNFKHIVRLDKIQLFNAVNLAEGYKPVQIYSPREITSHGKEG